MNFRQLQRRLRDPFDPIGDRRPGTVVVLPSMTLDHAGLAKIPGVRHYEERWLVFLQLLRRRPCGMRGSWRCWMLKTAGGRGVLARVGTAAW